MGMNMNKLIMGMNQTEESLAHCLMDILYAESYPVLLFPMEQLKTPDISL